MYYGLVQLYASWAEKLHLRVEAHMRDRALRVSRTIEQAYRGGVGVLGIYRQLGD